MNYRDPPDPTQGYAGLGRPRERSNPGTPRRAQRTSRPEVSDWRDGPVPEPYLARAPGTVMASPPTQHSTSSKLILPSAYMRTVQAGRPPPNVQASRPPLNVPYRGPSPSRTAGYPAGLLLGPSMPATSSPIPSPSPPMPTGDYRGGFASHLLSPPNIIPGGYSAAPRVQTITPVGQFHPNSMAALRSRENLSYDARARGNSSGALPASWTTAEQAHRQAEGGARSGRQRRLVVRNPDRQGTLMRRPTTREEGAAMGIGRGASMRRVNVWDQVTDADEAEPAPPPFPFPTSASERAPPSFGQASTLSSPVASTPSEPPPSYWEPSHHTTQGQSNMPAISEANDDNDDDDDDDDGSEDDIDAIDTSNWSDERRMWHMDLVAGYTLEQRVQRDAARRAAREMAAAKATDANQAEEAELEELRQRVQQAEEAAALAEATALARQAEAERNRRQEQEEAAAQRRREAAGAAERRAERETKRRRDVEDAVRAAAGSLTFTREEVNVATTKALELLKGRNPTREEIYQAAVNSLNTRVTDRPGSRSGPSDVQNSGEAPHDGGRGGNHLGVNEHELNQNRHRRYSSTVLSPTANMDSLRNSTPSPLFRGDDSYGMSKETTPDPASTRRSGGTENSSKEDVQITGAKRTQSTRREDKLAIIELLERHPSVDPYRPVAPPPATVTTDSDGTQIISHNGEVFRLIPNSKGASLNANNSAFPKRSPNTATSTSPQPPPPSDVRQPQSRVAPGAVRSRGRSHTADNAALGCVRPPVPPLSDLREEEAPSRDQYPRYGNESRSPYDDPKPAPTQRIRDVTPPPMLARPPRLSLSIDGSWSNGDATQKSSPSSVTSTGSRRQSHPASSDRASAGGRSSGTQSPSRPLSGQPSATPPGPAVATLCPQRSSYDAEQSQRQQTGGSADQVTGDGHRINSPRRETWWDLGMPVQQPAGIQFPMPHVASQRPSSVASSTDTIGNGRPMFTSPWRSDPMPPTQAEPSTTPKVSPVRDRRYTEPSKGDRPVIMTREPMRHSQSAASQSHNDSPIVYSPLIVAEPRESISVNGAAQQHLETFDNIPQDAWSVAGHTGHRDTRHSKTLHSDAAAENSAPLALRPEQSQSVRSSEPRPALAIDSGGGEPASKPRHMSVQPQPSPAVVNEPNRRSLPPLVTGIDASSSQPAATPNSTTPVTRRRPPPPPPPRKTPSSALENRSATPFSTRRRPPPPVPPKRTQHPSAFEGDVDHLAPLRPQPPLPPLPDAVSLQSQVAHVDSASSTSRSETPQLSSIPDSPSDLQPRRTSQPDSPSDFNPRRISSDTSSIISFSSNATRRPRGPRLQRPVSTMPPPPVPHIDLQHMNINGGSGNQEGPASSVASNSPAHGESRPSSPAAEETLRGNATPGLLSALPHLSQGLSSNDLGDQSAIRPNSLRTVSSISLQEPEHEVTDVDLYVQRLTGTSNEYEGLTHVADFIGPAQEAGASPEGLANLISAPVNEDSRRVNSQGRVKLKMSVVGVRVERCPVCHEQFRGGEAAVLMPTCGHVAHESCARKWFESKSSCMVCRTPLIEKD